MYFKITVKGRVQGVFFRVSTKSQAEELGVTGFVQNEPNGDVYLEAEGNRVQELIAWIKPEICNRISIRPLTHFKSVALLCLCSHHSGAMLSNPNCLIYCDLKPHHEPYRIIRVKAGGPEMARVDNVIIVEGQVQGFEGFEIR
ncbi:MAG: acylphosphatase [Cyclobacteriaceae bacterium]|nr:acylphosphatase [Cyclobacteriaceae bacterium]